MNNAESYNIVMRSASRKAKRLMKEIDHQPIDPAQFQKLLDEEAVLRGGVDMANRFIRTPSLSASPFPFGPDVRAKRRANQLSN